ncbi:hypothetical protein SPF06_14920 [Sinomonas sp. JGH33]|uniref:Subtilisin inhibitor domain-containing protein n=1 Tax=Sinomonas terricola TaxID=3110330 RepID=A0ABU5T9A5_9MICC|nr:hypothetical protein [Sinomonas sp. JGH33]MEA5456026.1 hypothetical protein [Sinomonas sp. JGH33]
MKIGPATALTAVAALVVLGVSGCEAPPNDDSPTSPAPSSRSASPHTSLYPAATGQPEIDLTITLVPGNAVDPVTSRVVCQNGKAVQPSTRADGNEACAFVKANVTSLTTPVPSDNCKKIDGGPQVADVFGRANGQLIRTSFKRTDKCQITAWDFMVPLIDPPGSK